MGNSRVNSKPRASCNNRRSFVICSEHWAGSDVSPVLVGRITSHAPSQTDNIFSNTRITFFQHTYIIFQTQITSHLYQFSLDPSGLLLKLTPVSKVYPIPSYTVGWRWCQVSGDDHEELKDKDMDKGKYKVPKRLNISKSMLHFPHPNFFLHSDDYHFISFGVVLKFTNVMLRSYLFSIQAHFKCCRLETINSLLHNLSWRSVCVFSPLVCFATLSISINFTRHYLPADYCAHH